MDSIREGAKVLGQQGQDLADKAAGAVKDTARSAQKSGGQAFDKLADKAEDAADKATPALKDATAQAQAAVEGGMAYLRDAWPDIRDWIDEAADRSIAYAKKEPGRALLIAAAVGGVLLGLVSLMGRSRR